MDSLEILVPHIFRFLSPETLRAQASVIFRKSANSSIFLLSNEVSILSREHIINFSSLHLQENISARRFFVECARNFQRGAFYL